jgi:hypothetical protein
VRGRWQQEGKFLMNSGQESDREHGAANHRVLRPAVWQQQERHIILGVSHPSDDPSRHRVFEVRATFDAALGGWVARVGEQNLNEQRGNWGGRLSAQDQVQAFPTAATCLGHATAAIIAAVDQDAQDAP